MTDPVALISADPTGGGQQGEITLSPTVWDFVMADDEVPILMGPRGEGKTVGGVSRLLRVASTNPGVQPLKVIGIRDTWVNLERTILETLLEGRINGWWDMELHDQGRVAILNGGMVKMFLFGMEFLPDANKLQGLSAAVGWLEEPAPAADLSSGIHRDVYGLLWSSLRQVGFPSSVQFTMNPPDAEHWTTQLESTEHIRVRRFSIPKGENPHLPVGYRERMRDGLIQSGRGDLVTRLVEGKVGELVIGEAVVANFSKAMHVADEPLPVYPQLEIIRGIDSGTPNLHPGIIWMQPGPFWLNVLGARVGTNVGIQEFIEEQVLPFERRYFRREETPVKAASGFTKAMHKGWRWRNIGDPSCLTPEGTSSQRTVALVIQNMLGGGFEPGPQDWDRVRQALLAIHGKSGKGDRKRFVQYDPEECDVLVRGLAGRFHFPVDRGTGRIIGTWVAAKRASGLFSHCVDALGYAVAQIYPPEDWVRTPAIRRRPTEQEPRSWVGR